jgi:ribosomal protein L11 methyltransferase
VRWIEISVEVASADGERALATLVEEGLAVEERDASTLVRSTPGRVVLVAWAAPEEAEQAAARIARALQTSNVHARIDRAARDEAAWRDAWKAHFRPRPVGPFVIVPSWERYVSAPGEIVLALDPGRAFGTGGHASTRLCLRAIGAVERPVRRFLDVGCGSGVLAIACALRWPGASGDALDLDPEAIEVTLENAAKNGVGARIAAAARPLATVEERFDLVLANLTAETLAELGPALAAHLAPGGQLVASGLLGEEAAAVADGFRRAGGLRVAARTDEEEWAALTLEDAGA